MGDRDRAVAHGVQLVEAARLEARRHQQHVGRRRDAVRQRDVEADPPARLVGVGRLQPPQARLGGGAGCGSQRRWVSGPAGQVQSGAP